MCSAQVHASHAALVLLIFLQTPSALISAQRVTISNVQPRLDVHGDIVVGGDGNILQLPTSHTSPPLSSASDADTTHSTTVSNSRHQADAQGQFLYYAVDYGGCREHVVSGTMCVHPITNTTCGFRLNHTVVAYASPNMSNGSWSSYGVVLSQEQRPAGVLFRPKVVYNPSTRRYVLWARSVPFAESGTALNWTAERYFAADSSAALGPFHLQNPTVKVAYGTGGDMSLFVDDDGAGYLVYTSHASNVRISVERLSSDFMSSTGNNSGAFGPTPVEAPAMFKRSGIYYVTMGQTCCYCTAGSGVLVYWSRRPLGPYAFLGQIGRDASNVPTTGAQQNFIATISAANQGEARRPSHAQPSITFLWTGTRWGTSPDGSFRHDFQYWLPMTFDDSTTPPMPHNLTWQDSVSFDV